MTVSSVKNLNGETFSAVQDASLTDIVSSNSANWNEISAYQANSANYLQNTDLSTEDGKVTAISGIPLSAGGDVPEGVMVESAVEYNAVNEISGYNGSAIAQYGAEKQWLVHDDTLVHAANSAQYALGVNLSAVAQLLGVDETVLWSGTITSGQTATLSENISAFNKVQCYVNSHNGSPYRGIITLETNGANTIYGACDTTWSNGVEYSILRAVFSGNMVSAMQSIIIYNGQNIAQNETITKVIGIGRKQ